MLVIILAIFGTESNLRMIASFSCKIPVSAAETGKIAADEIAMNTRNKDAAFLIVFFIK